MSRVHAQRTAQDSVEPVELKDSCLRAAQYVTSRVVFGMRVPDILTCARTQVENKVPGDKLAQARFVCARMQRTRDPVTCVLKRIEGGVPSSGLQQGSRSTLFRAECVCVCVRMRAQAESNKAAHKTAATQGEQDKGFGSYGAMRMNPWPMMSHANSTGLASTRKLKCAANQRSLARLAMRSKSCMCPFAPAGPMWTAYNEFCRTATQTV